jgi:hypothetical protein
MKIQLLYDIFLGFILLTIWLNYINGYLPSFFNDLSAQEKLGLYSLIIVLIPLFTDFVFNSPDRALTTFPASIISAVIALAVREFFAWGKEQNDMKREIFDELYENYRSTMKSLDWIDTFSKLHGINIAEDSEHKIMQKNLIRSHWNNQLFKDNLTKIRSKRIYDVEIIDDIKAVYSLIDGYLKTDIADDVSILLVLIRKEIKRILISLNEGKASQLLERYEIEQENTRKSYNFIE